MKKVYYMDFHLGKTTSLNKVGGLPTHLPKNFPVSKITGNPLGFLMQLYCDEERLNIQDALCLQIYQSVEIDDGDDPSPVILKLPKNSSLNTGLGVTHPDIEEYEINWILDEEPDELPFSLEMNGADLRMLDSKLKGATPAEYVEKKDLIFLGWIAEYPVGFNFAGLLVLLKDLNNNITYEII